MKEQGTGKSAGDGRWKRNYGSGLGQGLKLKTLNSLISQNLVARFLVGNTEGGLGEFGCDVRHVAIAQKLLL